MKEYDLVVVGSGAALSVLEAALELGLSCALVERSLFGGTCLTRGCIPSKVLVHPADVIREAQHARRIGLDLRVERIDWATLTRRMRHQIDGNQMIERDIGDVDGLDVYKGTAEFTGADTMLVRYADGTASEAFRGAKFLLAGGGRPFIPPIEGLAETGYLDSESFFGDQFPSAPWNRLVIIGGGAIGAEFAHIFSAFGTHVTIVEQLPELIMTEEPEIRELLTESFRHNGIDVLTDFRALRAFREAGQKVLEVENRSTGQVSTLRCDEILVSAGLRSNADLLHLERTTIRTDVNGWIFTDASLETTQPNVWAIGDINGKYQFRHKANYEAGICAQNMLGSGEGRALADYSSVPWAIFTWPQIAHVGMTEAQVQASGVRYLIGQRHYSSVAQGFAMGYEHGDVDDGFFKLIADDQYRILGAHIIGPQASVLIQSIVYLMNSGATCQIEKTGRLLKRSRQVCDAGGSFMPLNDSMVIHPALSEVVGWITGNLYWAGPHGEHTHEHDHDHGGHDHDHGGHDHDHGGHDHDHHGHDHDHRGHVHDPEAGDEPT